jgi:hypothetical protein
MDEQLGKYKEKMSAELTKFLVVYNDLSKTNFVLDMNDGYDIFIRILGNYIYKKFNVKTWEETKIEFSPEIVIDLSVFRNTPYFQKVQNFLISMKNAFYGTLDDDIYEYLEKTDEYTDEEKIVCKEFYDRVSALNNAMKHNIFESTEDNLMDKNNISKYSKELNEFNRYSNYVSSKPELYALISHFDQKIREKAKTKKFPDIFFDA